jgi:NAD(P)-dependent dehydrogenase (short-subunit alcohol dehydrogenase family)
LYILEANVFNMDGKTVLITGATNGIGRAAAKQLAGLGAHVVIVGRSRQKCLDTVQGIAQTTPGAVPVDFLLADLSSLAETRRLAAEFLSRFDRLDVLVNNAGAVFIRRRLTSEGLENGWAVNYFQAFLLTNLLLDRLKQTAAQNGEARIVTLSSIYHWAGRLNLNNFAQRGPYIGWDVYASTKLANLVFTYELARRLAGSGVTANALHPGLVATGIGKTSGWLLRMVFRVVDLFAIPPEQGAEGIVHLASSPELKGISGIYFEHQRPGHPSPSARNPDTARRLCEISGQITKLNP